MSKLGRNSFVTAGLALSALTLAGANGCSEAQKLVNDACCKDFQVGADMSAVSWDNSDPAVEANFSALAQGVGDFSALAAATASDVAGACQSIALALDPNTANDPRLAGDANATVDKTVGIWCDLAAKSIAAAKADINASAKLTAVVEPPQCEVQASFQAKCDAKCSVDVSVKCQAELGDINARCDPGQISGTCSGKCSGECTGSASVQVDCAGSCTGQCEGTCEATVDAPVECTGSCSAQCNGNCTVAGTTTASTGTCAGTCSGTCTGTCKMNAGVKATCKGKCTGGCDASCSTVANADLKCKGTCKASCDVTVTEPKCDVALKPPSAECSGKASADCSANCQASANARASCTPPRVAVNFTASVTGDAQTKLDKLARVLETGLPNIAAVFSARFDAIGKLGAGFPSQISKLGNLSTKSVACGAQVSLSISPAVTNLTATLAAANAISGVIALK